jgi:hypothetical protein
MVFCPAVFVEVSGNDETTRLSWSIAASGEVISPRCYAYSAGCMRSPRSTTRVCNWSATAARSRPGSYASVDDRSSCRGRSSQREPEARARDHHQARHRWGSRQLVRRLLRDEHVTATRRDPETRASWQPQFAVWPATPQRRARARPVGPEETARPRGRRGCCHGPWAPFPVREHAPVVPGCGYRISD